MESFEDSNLVVANLDHFSGGVPPLAFLTMRVEEVLQLSAEKTGDSGLNFVAELCVIGLAAYFEAFCKDQFAAIINIVPQTLVRFTGMRECKIPVKNLLHDLSNMSHKLGFIIAEEYDFGTAKYINSLFTDLFILTPFSKAEMVLYSEFLNDRNLLVHHGGVFTAKYASQKFNSTEFKELINMHSLTVAHPQVEKWAKFLLGVAEKLAKATSKAMLKFGEDNHIVFDEETKVTVGALEWS